MSLRAAFVIATAPGHRLAKIPARCRERANIVQVSSLAPPPPLYPSFALLRTRVYYGRWRRFCLPSAKYSPSPHGRGFCISSLLLRLRFGSFLRGRRRFATLTHVRVAQSLMPYLSVSFAPAPPAPVRITSRYCIGSRCQSRSAFWCPILCATSGGSSERASRHFFTLRK